MAGILNSTALSKSIWGFDPRIIPGCVLWLDGDDINTQFQDTAATTPVTATGQDVARWNDKSLSGLAFTNSSSATTPKTAFNSQNGRSTLSFTTSGGSPPTGGQSLATTTNVNRLPTGSASGAYFVVSRSTITYSLPQMLFSYGTNPSANNVTRQFYYSSNSPNPGTLYTDIFGATGRISDGTDYRNSYSILSSTMVASASGNNGWDNGNQFSGGDPTYPNGASLTSMAIGTTRASIGYGNNGTADSYWLNGNIAEILVFSNVLTTSERQQIEGYLAWKWGLQSQLATNHPYKNTYTVVRPFLRNFVPTDISNCFAWYDGGDRSSMTISGSNTITQWRDKSGNGNTLTTTNATTGPAIVTTTNNPIGYDIFYNAATVSTPFLQNSSISISSSTLTVFVVYWMAQTQTYFGRIFSTGTTNDYNTTDFSGITFYTASGSTNSNYIYAKSSNAGYGTSVTAGTTRGVYHIASLPMTTSPSISCQSFIDGTQSNSITNVDATRTFNFTQLALGRAFQGSNAFIGNINEVIVYSTQLSTQDRQRVEGYLAWKWGLQRSTIPTTHPMYRFPSATVTPFIPTIIDKCVLWLDAADSTTIQQIAGSVSQWTDKSGNSDNAVQASGSLQPTYANSALTFNGTTQYMTLSSPSTLPGGATPNGTYFFVVKLTSGSATRAFFMYGPNTMATGANPQFYYNSSNQLVVDTYGAGGTTDTTNSLNNTVILSSTISNTGGTGTVRGWDNGSAFGPTTYTTATITSQQGTIGVTKVATTLSFYLAGSIYEIIIFNAILTATQRQQVEGYLAWKWGIRTSLPTTHPYYKVPIY